LPDGSGFDVCRAVHTDPGADRMPIIFISADEDVSTKVQGFEAGGVDYVTKPIAATEVLARVRTHLRLKQAYERLAELQAERLEHLAAAQKATMPEPADLPDARFEVALRQVLTAGGDFYDVIPAGDRIVDYLVADASGHDLAASYWTAALKALAAEYAGPLNAPAEVVGSLNRSLCRILPPEAFFTLVYARLNRRTGRLCLVSAGHPPAVIVPGDGSEPVVVRRDGDVVGAFPDAVFGVVDMPVRAGDRLVLYSDGLIENGTTCEEGIRRLVDACATRRDLPLERMVPSMLDALVPGAAQDDIVLMAVET
jgi:sigma-B regulation protein RsbU (phosphoserine phosphatase)